MFEVLTSAARLPLLQLQCTSPAFASFTVAARSGALGYTMKQICFPQEYDGDLCGFYRSFFDQHKELK